MTREELIKRICPSHYVNECCSSDCTFDCDKCEDILVQMLAEYENQIREMAFDDFKKELIKIYHKGVRDTYNTLMEILESFDRPLSEQVAECYEKGEW